MKDPTEMTEQELRVAVAEACGWRGVCPNPLYPDNPAKLAGFQGGDRTALCGIPDFLGDLNACAAFEATLSECEATDYWCVYLPAVVGANTGGWMHKELPLIAGASAKSRCIAFLRVVAQRQPEAAIAIKTGDVRDA